MIASEASDDRARPASMPARPVRGEPISDREQRRERDHRADEVARREVVRAERAPAAAARRMPARGEHEHASAARAAALSARVGHLPERRTPITRPASTRQRDEQLDAVPEREPGVAGEVVLRDRFEAARRAPSARSTACRGRPARARAAAAPAPTSDERDGRRHAPRGALAAPRSSHSTIGATQEHGEVVGEQRQRAGQREQRHPRAPWARARRAGSRASRSAAVNTNSAYARASCEYHTNSGLTATSAATAIAARRPASSRPIAQRDGHQRDAAERRGEAQRDRAVPEHARVGPRDQVPQRRRVLGVRRPSCSVDDEARVQVAHDRERLVVPEALQVERRRGAAPRRAASARPAATSGRARAAASAAGVGAGQRLGGGAHRRQMSRAVLSRSTRSACASRSGERARQVPAARARRAPAVARSAPRSCRQICVRRPWAGRGWCCRTRPRAAGGAEQHACPTKRLW